jgi:hypothetical protein
MELIVVEPVWTGEGTTGDPRRQVTQVFTRDGHLFATVDPVAEVLNNNLRQHVSVLAATAPSCETLDELRTRVNEVAALLGVQS